MSEYAKVSITPIVHNEEIIPDEPEPPSLRVELSDEGVKALARAIRDGLHKELFWAVLVLALCWYATQHHWW